MVTLDRENSKEYKALGSLRAIGRIYKKAESKYGKLKVTVNKIWSKFSKFRFFPV